MSPIGRIAVFLNLALSAGFLGWAAATLSDAEKFRSQYDAKPTALAALERTSGAQIEALPSERDENARQRTDMRNQKDALGNQVTALNEQLNEKTDELNQLKANMSNIASTIGDLNSNLEDMKSQVAPANAAQVEVVNPGSCTARIINAVQGTQVVQGDRVSTRI